jgi:hypothetical protein
VNDTAILDWIERHVEGIYCPLNGGVKISWIDKGKDRETTGDDLRDAVRKAAGKTAVSKEAS